MNIPVHHFRHFRCGQHLFFGVTFFRTLTFLLLYLVAGSLHAQVKLWGMTTNGGEFGSGTIINLNPDGSDFNAVSFYKIIGANPHGDLLKASNGKLYGMTASGGSSAGGVIFEYDYVADAYLVVHQFSYGTDGAYPYGSLLESGGKFYGMTHQGGSNSAGTLFEFNPSGNVYTVLKHLDYSTDGAYPNGSLLESGGKFYGITSEGGSNGYGTLFEFNPSGNVLTVLKHLNYFTEGGYARGSLLKSGGKFYGMINQGGSNGYGTLFEWNPMGNVFTVLRHLDYSTDGAYPHGSLIESGGKFYGMTNQGGSAGYGTLFEFNPSGNVFMVLKNLDYATDGGYPTGSLLESGGKFYGMMREGGSNISGTLFEYNPSGNVYTVLKHLESSPDGTYPYGSLIESGGKFYGMVSSGGIAGYGTLFEFNPSGNVFTVLKHLESSPDGAYPYGSLLESGGKFYGMTNSGGSNNTGTLFEYNPTGNVYTVLKHLESSPDGAYPYGSLLESGGKFYGMTYQGGSSGYGTLFEFNPTGNVFTVLKNFDYSSDGAYPLGSLIESGGKFYGMTYQGGSFGAGTLFEYNPVGNVYTVLKHLDYYSDGGYPYGSLLESAGKFYGMIYQGGSFGAGTLFEYNPVSNVYTVLKNFDYYNDGGYPTGSLLESGGKFYGLTSYGGSNTYGTLFEYNPTGNVYTVLKHLNYSTDGGYPYGSLIESGGKFYGMTNQGGSNGYGTVFEWNPTGNVYTVLKNLDYYTDGAYPYLGNLIAVAASTTVEISGTIFWKGDGIASVNNAVVALSGDASGSDATDTNGDFDLAAGTGANFVITPSKNTGGLLNGVTAADATVIQQHLTGSSLITDFYRLVAADCNRSNNISSVDGGLIRQALLGNPSAMNILNAAGHWRFVRTDYVPVLAGPYTLDHYSLYDNRVLTGVSGAQPAQDFYGIKTGDVFEETNPGVDVADPSLKPDPSAQPVVWRVRDRLLKAGQTIELDFSVANFTDIAAFQYGMRFDPAMLQFQQASGTNAELALDQASHFGAWQVAKGELRTLWSVAEGKTLPGVQPAYRLRFKVLQGGKKLSAVLGLDPAILAALAYTTDLAQREVQLVFTEYGQPDLNLPDDVARDYFDLLQNRPNPVNDRTTIGFILPAATDAQLRVLDLSGRELWRVDKSYPAGYHEESFRLDELGTTGMLFYELTTPQGTQTRKMLALRK